jgi:ATP-dependent DNA ligase
VEALADLPAGTVLDGELVALDDSGRPDFNLLQNFRAEASRSQIRAACPRLLHGGTAGSLYVVAQTA